MNFIVVGAGEVGYHLASRLSQEKMNVVVIEKDESKVKRVIDTLDVQTIHGSGSSVEILKQAGIEDADILIAATNSDEVNMISCLVASAQSKVPIKIARIRNPEYAKNSGILGKKHLNIDLTINPELEMVRAIARLVEIPDATDVVEFAEGRVRISGIKVDPHSYVIGKRLRNLSKENEKHDIIIAAIFRDDQVIIPRGDDIIQENDLVYAVTESKKIISVTNYFKEKEQRVQRIMILGGGEIGVELAQRLEKKAIKTKLIEHDEQRCSEIAEKLKKTIVLRGNGTDRELLEEENISSEDLNIFHMVDTAEEAVGIIEDFYERYSLKPNF